MQEQREYETKLIFREKVGTEIMQHPQFVYRVDKNKCYCYISYGTNSLTPDVCKEYTAQLLTLVNTISINLTLFSHLAATQKAKAEKKIKLYLLGKSRQLWSFCNYVTAHNCKISSYRK